MKLFDFEKNVVVKRPLKKCRVVRVIVPMDEDDLEHYEHYYSKIEQAFETVDVAKLRENTVFECVLPDFIKDGELFLQLQLIAARCLIDVLIKDEPRHEEFRLSCQNKNFCLTYANLMRLVNYKTIVNCFGMSVVNKWHRVELVG